MAVVAEPLAPIDQPVAAPVLPSGPSAEELRRQEQERKARERELDEVRASMPVDEVLALKPPLEREEDAVQELLRRVKLKSGLKGETLSRTEEDLELISILVAKGLTHFAERKEGDRHPATREALVRAGLQAEGAALAEAFGLLKTHGRTDDGAARVKAKARLTRVELERWRTLEQELDVGILENTRHALMAKLFAYLLAQRHQLKLPRKAYGKWVPS